MRDDPHVRTVRAVRLVSLCRGPSGVSIALLAQLTALIVHDALPRIPSERSVGASGDLTPLSYVAAALCGERQVRHAGRERPAAEALAAVGLRPLRLRPKEGLALMNGTAVMAALACDAFHRASRLSSLAARLQDRCSLRCAPHVLGVLEDALPFFRGLIENELDSSNDNAITDPENEQVLHGGHFYGGHIAFAMDALKTTVANVAELLDHQFAIRVDTRYNHGLPGNLSGARPERAAMNHKLKALQISVSAWTAEALKGTMPTLVFSRST